MYIYICGSLTNCVKDLPYPVADFDEAFSHASFYIYLLSKMLSRQGCPCYFLGALTKCENGSNERG